MSNKHNAAYAIHTNGNCIQNLSCRAIYVGKVLCSKKVVQSLSDATTIKSPQLVLGTQIIAGQILSQLMMAWTVTWMVM